MLIFSFPIRQSIAQSNVLFRIYEEAKKTQDDEVKFDLFKTKSLTPFGIIMLTATITECQKMGKKCYYKRPLNRKLSKFLDEIGFHKHFHINGQEPIPDQIQTGRVQLKRISGLDPFFIETMTDIFDHHLNISRGVKGSLWMSLNETMTNVIDHSSVQDYYVCAYTYPPKRQIRLCIADLGIGILGSLKRSREYSGVNNDYIAVKMAVEEGVSCRSGRDGLGLCHIKNFIKVNEGQMCIISGDGKVFWKFDRGKTKILKQTMKIPFSGTIVKLIINIDKEGFYFLSDEKEYIF